MQTKERNVAESNLFQSDLHVVNVGIGEFAEALRRQSTPVVEVDWEPPAGGDPKLVALLKQMYGRRLAERIDAANQKALDRIRESQPQVVDVRPAGEALGLTPRTILHAGPPVEWDRMCGPQKRAVLGAIRFEGWAEDAASAEALIVEGEVTLQPCYRYGAVGPMTGIISPSMPGIVVQNDAFGTRAFSTFNEGRGNTLWFGVCTDKTLVRLRWIRDVFAPAIRAGIRQGEPLNVFDVVAQGLQMGDECHARSGACTAILIRTLVPMMLDAGVSSGTVADVVRFMADNSHFFLNFTMAGVKATMEAAHGIPYSTLVTAMSRNGVDFMLRVSGLAETWLVAPAPALDGALYYSGYSIEDAAGDIGDSAIIETCGLGGMAIAAAPTVAAFVGGSVADEIAAVRRLRTITLAGHPRFNLPTMDFEEAPLGIDVRRVVETQIVPFIDTGVLHERKPTAGQIGAGVAHAPLDVFKRALVALAYAWDVPTDLAQPEAILRLEPRGAAA